MPLHLFHITSLERLVSIVRKGRYIPAYSKPAASDSGLNAGIVDQPLTEQHFEARGARLILEFDGPLVKFENFPLEVGSVYDNLPWRVIVPHGTKEGLTMTGCVLDQNIVWIDLISEPPCWVFGTKRKTDWRRQKALELENEIISSLQKRPHLRVG